MLERLGAAGFAHRASVELEAIGERRLAPVAQTSDGLTPQEQQIVRLAADGESSAEIAAELFLSPHTVDHHLHKACGKLGIASRDQLAGAVADRADMAGQRG
jgi:DNA-binding CsgD family transcriptional regulator